MAAGRERTGALSQYLAEIGSHPLVSRDEEADLARRIRDGDERALEQLVSANLRFVVSVARNYVNRGIDLEELINEGNLGLITAARRYDETRGVRFLSYAVWWIRQAILAALGRQGRIVRQPAGRLERARRVSRATSRLSQGLHRPPREIEIAAELGVPVARVREVAGVGRGDVSLDAPLADGEETNLLELLPDQRTADPSEVFENAELIHALRRGVRCLPTREAALLRRYYGLDGREAETLGQIADSWGLSPERIRAIKDRALSRLRLGSAGHELRVLSGGSAGHPRPAGKPLAAYLDMPKSRI
jgi:RNA polymerase primary sigma factor